MTVQGMLVYILETRPCDQSYSARAERSLETLAERELQLQLVCERECVT